MSAISVTDLLHLSVAERIQLVEDLWDSIANRPEARELTEAQRLEIDRRLAEHDTNPESAVPGSGRTATESLPQPG